MSNDNGKLPVVNSTPALKDGERVVPTTITKDQDILIVNDATTALLDKAYAMQDNYENESKFRRAFTLDAVRSHVKAECSRLLAAWDAAIAKQSKLTPQKNRQECIDTLLEGRKARELKSMVDVAAGLKRELS